MNRNVLKFMEEKGYDKNIVVLTQAKDYKKKKNNLLFAMKMFMKKYPGVIDAMKKRHIQYNDAVDYVCKKEEKGEILVIRPKEKLPIGRIEKDGEKLKKVYELGREAALEKLDEIKKFYEG